MLQVLAPTDFSDNSYNALFYVAHLLKKEECTFHILNVFDKGDTACKNKCKEGLDAIAHRLIRDVGRNRKHKLKKIPLRSSLTQGVSSYAQQHGIDFMVIGNKGKDETKDILFGNNAMQLVREVNCCPILIVPLEIDFKKVEKIAFISNYSHPIPVEGVKALKFMNFVTESIVVPMTIEDGKDNKTILGHKTDFFNALSLNMSKEVILPVFEDKAKTILEFVDLWEIDMLGMVYYPHHFFLEFIGKGIIKELNVKLSVPFLILPFKAK
ncbi:MAG: universal stress protein [Allomuricauda sp.]